MLPPPVQKLQSISAPCTDVLWEGKILTQT